MMSPHPVQHTRDRTDRQANAARLQQQLADQVAQLADSEKWRAFLDFSGSFHSYSLNNCLLIWSQHPSATAVAGYRAWQAKGRQVRRGEKAIKIFGYTTKRVVADDPDTGEESARTVVRYPVLSVFAIDQTDPIEGVEDPATLARQLQGGDPAGLYDRVAAHLGEQGWQIERQTIADAANGYTTIDGSRLVVVDDQLSPAQAAKTALHEAAHVHLHVDPTTGRATTRTDDQRVGHDGIGEVEAESVAYVLAGMAGLDTSDYSVGYLAAWADGDVDQVRATAARVLDAVDHLAPALTPNEEPDKAAVRPSSGTAVEANASTDGQSRLADQLPTRHRGRQRRGGRSLPRQRLATALAAADRGWHVFPLAPNRKTPVIRSWEQRATTDPDRIERAWTPTDANHGRWNIGIACGPSGLLVVDLDIAQPAEPIPDEYARTRIRTGADVLTDLQTSLDDEASLPATYQVRTPSGGRHLYYRQPSERLGNSTGKLGWLVDTRGHGGYVVAASSTVDGRPYRADDLDAAVSELPGWLTDRLSTPPPVDREVVLPAEEARRAAYLEAAVHGEIARVLASPAHTHNQTLFTASAALGRLVAGGHLDRAAVRGALVAAGEAVGQPPREASATVDSGLRNATNNRPIESASGDPAPAPVRLAADAVDEPAADTPADKHEPERSDQGDGSAAERSESSTTGEDQPAADRTVPAGVERPVDGDGTPPPEAAPDAAGPERLEDAVRQARLAEACLAVRRAASRDTAPPVGRQPQGSYSASTSHDRQLGLGW